MTRQLKICVAVLAGVLACGSLKAQQADSQAKPHEVYCEIVSTGGGFFTNKTTVEVDFGQFASCSTPSWTPPIIWLSGAGSSSRPM